MTDTPLPGAQDHVFLGADHDRNETRTWIVIGLTAAMMVGEITVGTLFNSMALVADGWHMFTDASSLLITAFAYRFARRHANNPRFTFGTGKVGDLAAFASALVLGVVSVLIAWDSLWRLVEPVPIGFSQAIPVAVIGLAINLFCAWILGGHGHSHAAGHDDEDGHAHDHDPSQHGDHAPPAAAIDNNLRAAYLHVLGDALTSVLAICGLLLGRHFGWVWLDPVIGLVGSVVIARWSVTMMRDAGRVLVDHTPAETALQAAIRAVVESGGDAISDLHVWQLGPGHHGAILSVVSDTPQSCAAYRDRLTALPGLSHVTVEVHRRA
jgi:cation diffusion facilitator family transporter